MIVSRRSFMMILSTRIPRSSSTGRGSFVTPLGAGRNGS